MSIASKTIITSSAKSAIEFASELHAYLHVQADGFQASADAIKGTRSKASELAQASAYREMAEFVATITFESAEVTPIGDKKKAA